MITQNNTNTQDYSQEDEEWLTALHGTSAGIAESEVQKEARILGKVIMKKHAEIVARPVDESELQQFRDRLHREHLWEQPFYKQTKTWAMAASLIVAVGLGVVMRPAIFQEPPATEELRGVDNEMTVIAVEDPKATSTLLSQQLTEIGVVAKLSKNQGDLILDAYVPVEKEDAVNALLHPIGARVENKGRVLLLFKQGIK